jgi:hypothetical protein
VHDLEVPENLRVPAKVLDLRSLLVDEVRGRLGDLDMFLDGERDGSLESMFEIDPKSGLLLLISSPDRERRSSYQFRVKAVLRNAGANAGSDEDGPKESASKVPVLFYTLYLSSSDTGDNIVSDQIQVNINIGDENDNRPEFLTLGKPPIVASVEARAELGERVSKVEAWDADVGLNADIRYALFGPSSSYFSIDASSGEVAVKRSLANEAGKTFQLEVEARDRQGRKDGQATRIDLVVHVLDSSYQMTLVLSSSSDHVLGDMSNITKMLSDISGFSVHKHFVEGVGAEQTNLRLYAIEDNSLVNADRMARSLSPQLSKAQSLLSPHGLVEVRIGPHLLTTAENLQVSLVEDNLALSEREQDNDSGNGGGIVGGMGSLEIALLGMACAIFFGALIALVTICSIRYKR